MSCAVSKMLDHLPPEKSIQLYYFCIGMIGMWHGILQLFMQNAWTFAIVMNEDNMSFCTSLCDYRIIPCHKRGMVPGTIVQVHYSILNPDNWKIIEEPALFEDTYVAALGQVRNGILLMALMGVA